MWTILLRSSRYAQERAAAANPRHKSSHRYRGYRRALQVLFFGGNGGDEFLEAPFKVYKASKRRELSLL